MSSWLVSLSTWSVILQAVSTFWNAAVCTGHLSTFKLRTNPTDGLPDGLPDGSHQSVSISRQPRDRPVRDTSIKVLWFLHNISHPLILTSSALFWAEQSVVTLSAQTLTTHVLSPVYVVLDVVVTAVPCHIVHIYHPLSVLTLYLAFSVGYLHFAQEAVHTSLTWFTDESRSVKYAATVMAVCAAAYLAIWVVSRCRVYMYVRSHPPPPPPHHTSQRTKFKAKKKIFTKW